MGDNHVLSPILATHSESDKHSHADRVVLALRYPSRSDAVPIATVSKEIAGRRYWLAVYDADILAALLRMGWGVA